MKMLFKLSAVLLGLAIIVTVINAVVDVIMKSNTVFFTPDGDGDFFSGVF